MKSSFLFILLIGLAVRLILVGNPGFIADISFWKSWGLAAIDHGIVWTTHNTNINYPPSFIYVLWFMGKLYSLFADPHNFNTFWRENNFLFLLVSKSVAIVSDIAVACLIYWFFSQKEKLQKLGAVFTDHKSKLQSKEHGMFGDIPLLLASVFFLNPVVILDSALWGQVESYGMLFTLLAIILLFYKKPLLATAIFTVGCLMKLQNIIYIPLYFLFIIRYFDVKTALRSVAVAVGTFFFINLPFIIANDMNQVLSLLTVNSDYFPWLSLNAHNLWWIVAGTKGMTTTDRITALGILNAKTVGLVIFASSYLLSVILLYLRPTPRNLLLALTVGIFAFFLFTTQSHERYSYPVLVFLLFLYPFLKTQSRNIHAGDAIRGTLDKKAARRSESGYLTGENHGRTRRSEWYFWCLYVFLTAAVFFNIHTGLILNYPENGFATLTHLTTPALTILNSYVLILLFFLLLPFVFSQISWMYTLVSLFILAFGLISLHLSFLTTGKVSLTFFRPIISKQDFAHLQTNKSVNSYSGWKSWSRLSNNYLFYRKGFGTHANSTVVFDINRKFTTFSTDFGVDTEAGIPATVVFKILGDEKELFTSGKMGRFDFPKHADVNVTGVKRLSLVVTDAGDGINSDHADWLNPLLIR